MSDPAQNAPAATPEAHPSEAPTPAMQAVGGLVLLGTIVLIGFGIVSLVKGPRSDGIEALRPPQQVAVLEAISEHQAQYQQQANELQMSAVKKRRNQAVRMLIPDGVVSDWVGVLNTMGTTSEGSAYIALTIGESVTAQTWNNALSDIGSRTLISSESPLYGTISEMSEGDRVRFSGKLLTEASMTESGGMMEPEFIFRFSKVSRIVE
jgi:hypothetical protein